MDKVKLRHKKCLACSTTFYGTSNEGISRWNKRKFCLKKCKHTFYTGKKRIFTEEWINNLRGRKMPTGENHHSYRGEILRSCFTCKKELTMKQSGNRNKFCSMKCCGLYYRGENSPVWVGERSKHKLRSRLFHLWQWKEWHSSILKRDNFTCVLCGKGNYRNGNKRLILEVDHYPIPFRKIVEGKELVPIGEILKLPKLFDLNNGRTLCRSCHKKNYH